MSLAVGKMAENLKVKQWRHGDTRARWQAGWAGGWRARTRGPGVRGHRAGSRKVGAKRLGLEARGLAQGWRRGGWQGRARALEHGARG